MRTDETQSLCEEGMEIADTVKEALGTYGEIFEEHIAKKRVVQEYAKSL